MRLVQFRFQAQICFFLTYYDLNKIPIKLSRFHGQTFQFWKLIFNSNFSPHNSTFWNNRTILAGRKSIFLQDWYDKNIIFVNDLLDANGELLIFSAFLAKYALLYMYCWRPLVYIFFLCFPLREFVWFVKSFN